MYLFLFFVYFFSFLNSKTPTYADSEVQDERATMEAEEQRWSSEKKVEYVTELTSDDFFEKVATGYWLVQFYVPWCGMCFFLCFFPFFCSSNFQVFAKD